MKISIAMATYNGQSFIRNQLESLALQTRCPDELVIADDCSTDETLQIIDMFSKDAPFQIRIYKNDKNIGISKNFESAIGYCKGDVIFLCDQDDVWYPWKIERMASVLEVNSDFAFVLSNADFIDEHGRNIGGKLWEYKGYKPTRQSQFTSRVRLETLLRYAITTGMCTAFRESVRDLAGPVKDGVAHDKWYVLVAAAVGEKGAIVNSETAGYRQHSGQAVGTRGAGFVNKVKRLFTSNANVKFTDINCIENILLRLNELGCSLDSRRVNYMQDRALHLKARESARCSPLIDRVKIIFREVKYGRYKAHSGSARSAISDIFLF